MELFRGSGGAWEKRRSIVARTASVLQGTEEGLEDSLLSDANCGELGENAKAGESYAPIEGVAGNRRWGGLEGNLTPN